MSVSGYLDNGLLEELKLDIARFAAEIKRLRGNRSQAWLAEEADVVQTYVSGIESQRKIPSPEVIIKLAHALKVDSGDLFRLLDPEVEEAAVSRSLELPPELPDTDRGVLEYLIGRLAGDAPIGGISSHAVFEEMEAELENRAKAMQHDREVNRLQKEG